MEYCYEQEINQTNSFNLDSIFKINKTEKIPFLRSRNTGLSLLSSSDNNFQKFEKIYTNNYIIGLISDELCFLNLRNTNVYIFDKELKFSKSLNLNDLKKITYDGKHFIHLKFFINLQIEVVSIKFLYQQDKEKFLSESGPVCEKNMLDILIRALITKVSTDKVHIFQQIFEKERRNLQIANKLYNKDIYDLFDSKILSFDKIFFILYDIAYIRRIYTILFEYFDHYHLKFPDDKVQQTFYTNHEDYKEEISFLDRNDKKENHGIRHRKHNFYNLSKSQNFTKTVYNKIILYVFIIKYFGKEPKNLEIYNGAFTILSPLIKVL
jgi:hypothetical protein